MGRIDSVERPSQRVEVGEIGGDRDDIRLGGRRLPGETVDLPPAGDKAVSQGATLNPRHPGDKSP